MFHLVLALALYQDPSPETLLAKIEKHLESAKTVKVQVKVTATIKDNGEDQKASMVGILLLKEKNKVLVSWERTDKGHEEKLLVVSDGQFLEGHSKYLRNPISLRTPPDVGTMFTTALTRGGSSGLATMAAVYCGLVHDARGMEKDPKKLIVLSDLKKVDSKAGEIALAYSSKIGTFGNTTQSTLWLDSHSFKPLRGKGVWTSPTSEFSSEEVYEEYDLNVEIPDDRFHAKATVDIPALDPKVSTELAERLLDRIRSGDVEQRRAAGRQLRDFGKAAVPSLEKASRDQDPEVAAIAKELLAFNAVADKLTPALLVALPGIDERLVHGDAHTWTEIFLDADERAGRNPQLSPLKSEDFERIVGPAMKAARRGREIQRVLEVVQRRELKSASAEIIQTLKTGHPEAQLAALDTLGYLNIHQAARDIVPLLSNDSPVLRARAGWALGFIAAKEFVPELLPLLKDSDPAVRKTVLEALQALSARECVPAITRLLADPIPDVKVAAARALSGLGAKSSAADLLPLLEDRDGGVVESTILALADLQMTDGIPAIAKLLKDSRRNVQEAALFALVQLRAVEESPIFLELLGQNNKALRVKVLEAVRSMEMREALIAVQDLLEDEAPSVRLAATNVLVRLGDKTHITLLNRRLKDSSPEVRLCAASALARLGVREVCPGILDQAVEVRGLNSLNALRQPDLWQKLANTSLASDLEGSRPEMIRQIAKQGGVAVYLSESFIEQESSSQNLRPILCRSNRTKMLSALEDLTRRDCGFVLESGLIRILTQKELADFWNAWWKDAQRGTR